MPRWRELDVLQEEVDLSCFYITTLLSDERALRSILCARSPMKLQRLRSQKDYEREYVHSISMQIANTLVGQFTVVLISSTCATIITDLVRTFPVFYARSFGDKRGWVLSDSAPKVLEALRADVPRTPSLHEPNPDALQEFLRAGYVSGSHTLLPDIKQAEAGTVTLLTADGELSTTYYFSYATTEYAAPNDISVERCLELMISRVCEFAESCGSRTVVIPLSGGLDSRFLASVFSQSCKLDVLAFSYGKPGSPEMEISKAVASTLRIPWFAVEYDERLFEEVVRGGVFDEYIEFAHNYSSAPHIQDLFAVYRLKKEKIIPDDAIFVPGHTGDFYSGAHILPGVELIRSGMPKDELQALAELIYLYHFYLDGHFRKSKIVKRIRTELATFPGTPWSVLEDWDRRNRQAKYIVNSLRVYEFFGYSHAMPFWHRKIAEFFKCVPREFKDVFTEGGLQRNLYVRAVRSLFQKLGVDFPKDFSKRFRRYDAHLRSHTGWRRVITTFKDALKEHLPNSLQRALLCALRNPSRLETTYLHAFDEFSRVLELEKIYGCFGIQRVVIERTLEVIGRSLQ